MRKIILALFITCSMTLYAQHESQVGNTKLGTVYEEALTSIKAEFGNPETVSTTQVKYKNVLYKGFKFDELYLNFRNNKFCEARFYMNALNKQVALNLKESLAKAFGQSQNLSKDLEEDGSTFYKGGRGPFGVGHLFTIFSAPNRGRWTAQLRYGPFNY
ncbi:MAG: hypothetical protein MSD82_00235 [Prevotella sp.]|nr:hypothetical protein [Prevotella sp.]